MLFAFFNRVGRPESNTVVAVYERATHYNILTVWQLTTHCRCHQLAALMPVNPWAFIACCIGTPGNITACAFPCFIGCRGCGVSIELWKKDSQRIVYILENIVLLPNSALHAAQGVKVFPFEVIFTFIYKFEIDHSILLSCNNRLDLFWNVKFSHSLDQFPIW